MSAIALVGIVFFFAVFVVTWFVIAGSILDEQEAERWARMEIAKRHQQFTGQPK